MKKSSIIVIVLLIGGLYWVYDWDSSPKTPIIIFGVISHEKIEPPPPSTIEKLKEQFFNIEIPQEPTQYRVSTAATNNGAEGRAHIEWRLKDKKTNQLLPYIPPTFPNSKWCDFEKDQTIPISFLIIPPTEIENYEIIMNVIETTEPLPFITKEKIKKLEARCYT
ncbi:MAG: hypothetical protein V3T58_07835 [Candidatus Hydrothermarchaeales archaeon]